jgi:hypothetical protein
MARIVSGGSRGLWVSALLVATLFVALALPLVTGGQRLVLRDTLVTHRPLKAFGAQALSRGEVPAVNPTWALGQPFAGNPNALPFYPGNLLYQALPFETAFHLHFVLHWLLACLAMRKLAAELGAGAAGALLAGVTYAGSGYLLSTLSFYNLIAVAAWCPLVLWGLVRGDRRGTLAGGVACGMMLLAGEPLTAALVVPAMAIAAIGRWGWRGGLGRALAVGGIGLAIASPQIVATARVLPSSQRALEGVAPAFAALQSLHPARLLELLLPLPWGWPHDFGRLGFWAKSVTPHTPYVYSLHVGALGVALALAGAARARAWALLAAAGLALAWAGGVAPGVLSAASAGLFRYPQKLLLWFTLGAAIAAGFGVARLVASPRLARLFLALGSALVALAIGLGLGFARFAGALAPLAEPGRERMAAAHAVAWIAGLAVAGVAIAAAGVAARRGADWVLVALQGLALFQLAPVVATDDAALYREAPPFFAALGERRALVGVSWILPEWEPGPRYPLEVQRAAGLARLTHLDLEPAAGIPLGLSYPLAPDLEGIFSPLSTQLARGLARAPWPERIPWLARLGAEAVVRSGPGEVAGLAPLARETRWGATTELLAVPDPAPPLAWPREVRVSPDARAVFDAIASGAVPADVSLVARPVAHAAGGKATLVAGEPDRLVVDVESAGGLLVVRRAFQPFYRARNDDGRELRTLPVDLALLGVEVPPGAQRVTIAVPRGAETAALVFAGLIAVAALVGAALAPGPRGEEP